MLNHFPAIALLPLLLTANAFGQPSEGQRHTDQPDRADANTYFHLVNPMDAQDFLDYLQEIDDGCKEVQADCAGAQSLLENIFDQVRREELPDVVLFVRGGAESGLMKSSQPVLMWNRKNTPFVRGAEHIWVLAFSDAPFHLAAELVPIHRRSGNPFTGFFSLLSVGGAPAEKESEVSTTCFDWKPLTQKGRPQLYLGIARLPTQLDTVNFLSLSRPPAKNDGTVPVGPCKDTVLPQVASANEGSTKVRDEDLGIQLRTTRTTTLHFSNTRAARTTFGFGLAATFNTEDSSIDEPGTEVAFNGYGLAKLYIRRPRLRAFQEQPGRSLGRSRTSVSVIAGTNLTDDIFDQLLVAVGIGDIIGRVGVFFGVNRVPGRTDAETGVKTDARFRPIFGLEYSF